MRPILLFISFLSAAAIFSCRPSSVIPPPGPPSIPGPHIPEGTISIALLKTLYKGAPVLITGEYLISGAVVSDDRLGNFHKTLVLDDGTAGIEVRVDMEQIFKRFMIHTRATVRCNGLWLGSYGGTLQLGAGPFDDFQTRPLPPSSIAEHLSADTVFYGEIRAHTLSFGELSLRRVSTFVAFEGVSFSRRESGLSWADTPADPAADSTAAATNRHLVDSSGDTLIVRTSRYARFASWPLPAGSGRIEGILGYFNGDYQLVVSGSESFVPFKDFAN